MESMSWPLTPKSHSLISPRELTRMLEGFTSTVTGGFGREERGKIRLCNISYLDLNRGNHIKKSGYCACLRNKFTLETTVGLEWVIKDSILKKTTFEIFISHSDATVQQPCKVN